MTLFMKIHNFLIGIKIHIIIKKAFVDSNKLLENQIIPLYNGYLFGKRLDRNGENVM